MGTKFTSGPWEAHSSGVYQASGSGLCIARRHADEFDDERWEANARLIAAAPELLALAQELRYFLASWAQPEKAAAELARQCDAVIAKATGKEVTDAS